MCQSDGVQNSGTLPLGTSVRAFCTNISTVHSYGDKAGAHLKSTAFQLHVVHRLLRPETLCRRF